MVNCWIIEAENQNALDHPKLDALNLQIETKLVVKLCVLHALSLYGQNTFNICNYEGKTLTTRAFFVEHFSLAASNGFFMSII